MIGTNIVYTNTTICVAIIYEHFRLAANAVVWFLETAGVDY